MAHQHAQHVLAWRRVCAWRRAWAEALRALTAPTCVTLMAEGTGARVVEFRHAHAGRPAYGIGHGVYGRPVRALEALEAIMLEHDRLCHSPR